MTTTKAIIRTKNVLIAVPKLDSTLDMPILASMEVNAAKIADKKA